MSKRKDRLKKKQQQLRREARQQIRLARQGKVATWKIVVPVIAFLFLLHCRFWYLEEEWLMRTALTTFTYLDLRGNVFLLYLFLGVFGWLLYAYRHCDEKEVNRVGKTRWWLRNLAFAFMWGSGLGALVTNVTVVFLFWLNGCVVSQSSTHEYKVVKTMLSSKPRARVGRHSAGWLINSFPYGEFLLQGEGKSYYLYMVLETARPLTNLYNAYLNVELAEGCLGWGIVRRIDSAFTLLPQVPAEHALSSGEMTLVPKDSCSQHKSNYIFKYTWRDIHIFAKLRGINLSDTTHVRVDYYVDKSRDIPVWEIDVRDSIQLDVARVILIHGETGEVLMDSYE